MKTVFLAVLAVSSLAFAGPPPSAAPGGPPSRWDRGGEHGAEAKEELQRKLHLMLVVGLADAMGLNETEALRLSDRLKVFEDKRRPVREGMGEAMKILKSAADGDASAAAQVDAAVQKVLDGRQQMAALDKEMFQGLSKDLTPQRRAQLALFLARFHAEVGKMGKGGGGHGRHHRF